MMEGERAEKSEEVGKGDQRKRYRDQSGKSCNDMKNKVRDIIEKVRKERLHNESRKEGRRKEEREREKESMEGWIERVGRKRRRGKRMKESQ